MPTPSARSASIVAIESGPDESLLTSLVPSASAAKSSASTAIASSAGTGTLPTSGLRGGSTIRSWTTATTPALEHAEQPHQALPVDRHHERRVVVLALHLQVFERRSEAEEREHVHGGGHLSDTAQGVS